MQEGRSLIGRVPWEARWPILVHFAVTFGIAAAVCFLVDRHSFGITLRTPSVPQADGTVASAPYTLLQSDITTLLSLSLAVLRSVATLSAVTITWRCAYFLMGKEEGITLRDIKWIIGFGLPTRPKGAQTEAVVLVALILILAFPSQLSSPILTGSITWRPSTNSMQGVVPVKGIPSATVGVPWRDYRGRVGLVDAVAEQAAGIASAAWGNNSTSISMARVLPTIRHLPNGAELANITVPYFKIESLQWIEDIQANITPAQREMLTSGNNLIQENPQGPHFALVPDSRWGPSMNNFTFPSPTTISETRLLMVLLDYSHSITKCSHTTGYFGQIPPKADLYTMYYPDVTICLAFAHVTYHAGAAVCYGCRLSDRFVFSNTTALDLKDDVMTTDALALMFVVSEFMVFGNFSLPSPVNNIDNYVREGLSRSYQASWTTLHQKFGTPSTSLSTNVTIPIPLSRADVKKWRVLVWLVVNLLFTTSGLVSFLAIQEEVIVDVTIAAMLLETDDPIREHPRLGRLSVLAENDQHLRLRLTYRDTENQCRFLTLVTLPQPADEL